MLSTSPSTAIFVRPPSSTRCADACAPGSLREGHPRRLPDKGTYWHLGKEVKTRINRPVRPFEHPELNKPKPPPRKSKGDREVEREKAHLREKERRKIRKSGLKIVDAHLPRQLRCLRGRPDNGVDRITESI